MSRWRKAVVASSVGLAAVGTLIVLSSPGQADSYIARYRCVGGVAGTEPVELEAAITPKIETGPALNVAWSLKYLGARRFGSPGFFTKGSLLSLEGTVDITGAWDGQLRPKGGKDQAEVVPGDFLALPDGLSDSGTVQRPGTIRITPRGLLVKFTPAEGSVMVNNKNPLIDYTAAAWNWEYTAEEFGDHLNDLQKTEQQGAVAKLEFTGTRVAYIGRREPGLGPIRVLIDGHPVTDPLVEPGKNKDGSELTGTKTKEVLWESPELEYKKHTIEIVNVEAKPAYLDAFKVTTSKIAAPPAHNQATCTILNPGSIEITAPGNTATPTVTPTTPTPTATATSTSTATSTATTTTPPHDWEIGTDPRHVSVVVKGTPNTNTGTSATPGATSTKYVKAQVAKTPKGGVDTGEAPESGREPYALMAGGSMLLLGSVTGGLLLRRRRAEHSGGADA